MPVLKCGYSCMYPCLVNWMSQEKLLKVAYSVSECKIAQQLALWAPCERYIWVRQVANQISFYGNCN